MTQKKKQEYHKTNKQLLFQKISKKTHTQDFELNIPSKPRIKIPLSA